MFFFVDVVDSNEVVSCKLREVCVASQQLK